MNLKVKATPSNPDHKGIAMTQALDPLSAALAALRESSRAVLAITENPDQYPDYPDFNRLKMRGIARDIRETIEKHEGTLT